MRDDLEPVLEQVRLALRTLQRRGDYGTIIIHRNKRNQYSVKALEQVPINDKE